MIESPEFNFKNPLISVNEVQRYKIRYKDEHSLQELHKIWLQSIDSQDRYINMEENRKTLHALDQLIAKQDGIDEDDSLIKNLAHILYTKILNIHEFKIVQRNKEMAAAEQKNKYKGQKCELKPTSMEFNIIIKNLQLSENYFDQSQKIIAEQQKQL